MQYVFCNTCDEPGDRIQEEEDAAIARQEPFLILPVPYAKPNVLDQPYDWQAEEAQVFNFVASLAPARNFGGSANMFSAPWAAIYMANVINEGTRPASWIATARTVLATCLTYILTQQYGSSTGTAGTPDNPRYGGMLIGASYATANVSYSGLAFLKGYAALGAVEYLNAAKRCATFLRHVQCGDLQTTAFMVFPSGGGPYHSGGLASSVISATGLLSTTYLTLDCIGLWFLSELESVVGSSATFGDATATAFFSAPTAATLGTMISELGNFARDGIKDSAHSGALVPGLSPTAPHDTYTAATNGGSGTATWDTHLTITSVVVSIATRGVFEAFGATAQVASIVEWLASFTANPANATPPTNTPAQTLAGITGTYDPSVCPATSLTTSAPFTEATGAAYDLFSLGLLSAVFADVSPATLRNGRSAVSPGQPYSTYYLDVKYLGVLGRAGLSFQPMSTATTSVPDVFLAAGFGDVYRHLNP